MENVRINAENVNAKSINAKNVNTESINAESHQPSYEEIVTSVFTFAHADTSLTPRAIAKKVSSKLDYPISKGQVNVILNSALPPLPWSYGGSLQELQSQEAVVSGSERLGRSHIVACGLAVVAGLFLSDLLWPVQHVKPQSEREAMNTQLVESQPAIQFSTFDVRPATISNNKVTVTHLVKAVRSTSLNAPVEDLIAEEIPLSIMPLVDTLATLECFDVEQSVTEPPRQSVTGAFNK